MAPCRDCGQGPAPHGRSVKGRREKKRGEKKTHETMNACFRHCNKYTQGWCVRTPFTIYYKLTNTSSNVEFKCNTWDVCATITGLVDHYTSWLLLWLKMLWFIAAARGHWKHEWAAQPAARVPCDTGAPAQGTRCCSPLPHPSLTWRLEVRQP